MVFPKAFSFVLELQLCLHCRKVLYRYKKTSYVVSKRLHFQREVKAYALEVCPMSPVFVLVGFADGLRSLSHVPSFRARRVRVPRG